MTLTETIDNEIQNQVPQMISDVVTSHTHNGSDSPQLDPSQSIIGAPAQAITPASGGALSTGGALPLQASDTAILANAIQRIADLESRLQALELLS